MCSWAVDGCRYKSKWKGNVTAHEKCCQIRAQKEPQSCEAFTREELGEIFGETHCSQVDFNTIIRAVSKKLGKHWFPNNIPEAAAEYASAMGTHFKTEVVECQDSEGNPIQRTIACCTDTNAFLDAVGIGRGGINKERVCVSADKGRYSLTHFNPSPNCPSLAVLA